VFGRVLIANNIVEREAGCGDQRAKREKYQIFLSAKFVLNHVAVKEHGCERQNREKTNVPIKPNAIPLRNHRRRNRRYCKKMRPATASVNIRYHRSASPWLKASGMSPNEIAISRRTGFDVSMNLSVSQYQLANAVATYPTLVQRNEL
jgi:hypothetical protein